MKEIKTQVAIVGAGLGGLLLARRLSDKGLKVALFDSHQQLGGLTEPVPTPIGDLDHGIKWIPDLPESRSLLSDLRSELGDLGESFDNSPIVTFEKNEFIDFVGFGEKVPEAIDEWQYYLHAGRIEFEKPIHAWSKDLNSDRFDFYPKYELTRIEAEDEIKCLYMNGDIRVLADAYVVCSHPGDVFKLLPSNKIDPKIRQKLSKSKFWTSINLTMVHRGIITEQLSPLIFIGSGEKPSVILGRFSEPIQNLGRTFQSSQWLTLAHAEDSDDESYASIIRDLKKQIQKPWPDLLKNLEFEKLIVTPRSHGSVDLKFEKNQSLQGFTNLWLAGHSVASSPNIPGSIQRSLEIIAPIEKALSLKGDGSDLNL